MLNSNCLTASTPLQKKKLPFKDINSICLARVLYLNYCCGISGPSSHAWSYLSTFVLLYKAFLLRDFKERRLSRYAEITDEFSCLLCFASFRLAGSFARTDSPLSLRTGALNNSLRRKAQVRKTCCLEHIVSGAGNVIQLFPINLCSNTKRVHSDVLVLESACCY